MSHALVKCNIHILESRSSLACMSASLLSHQSVHLAELDPQRQSRREMSPKLIHPWPNVISSASVYHVLHHAGTVFLRVWFLQNFNAE